ncbi:glycosyltransferase [Thauera aromatica]|uniref:glycosyltransferase n=1 Tax=Thauera aromatica TaxID=59405 RepID=UPI001FFCCEF8|nr:glycosyltransferase [Thauera aromatica]MCK2086872.1 glycosyltransferase [Thauera aromatica]
MTDSSPPALAALFPPRPPGGPAATYAQPVPALAVEGMGDFPALLLAIWQLRDQDLQPRYPLDTTAGRLGFLAWSVGSGGREYQALHALDSFWDNLAQPAVVPASEWSGGISRFLRLAIAHRTDLGIDPALPNADSQAAALGWFWCTGGWRDFDPQLLRVALWQARFLLDHSDLVKTRFAQLVYRQRPDLQAAFDLRTTQGQSGLGDWLQRYAHEETSLLLLQRALQADAQTTLRATPAAAARERSDKPHPFGVNLIGYAFGELGIGEDVRMAAHACHAAGIPFCVIDFAPGGNIRQHDRSIAPWVVDTPRYGINLVCLTALEHLRLFVERGAEHFEGRYTIGYWPWELQDWPANWVHCFNLVDEAWASSRHIEQAMRRVSPVPVCWMPMAVRLPAEVDTAAPPQRARFGLPADKTLFVFSFDGNSFIERKNPLGVLEAFLRAFPADTGQHNHVGLVIKCMRPDPRNHIWQRIRAQAQEDTRIVVIDAMLDKAEVLELYRACDCFVSLHRAEGFGRGIAEALLLGLDVIATDYGGNVDFCRPAGARLVPARPQHPRPQDYVEARGNSWADPDLDAAAAAMRELAVVQDRRHTRGKAALARAEFFAPATIGARYQQRLTALQAALHPAADTIRPPRATPLDELRP